MHLSLTSDFEAMLLAISVSIAFGAMIVFSFLFIRYLLRKLTRNK
jgi:hypothetical protein